MQSPPLPRKEVQADKTWDMAPRELPNPKIVLPEAEFLPKIPRMPHNARRHVGIFLAFLKHQAQAKNKWKAEDDTMPFDEKVKRLFEANDIKSVCDVGGSDFSEVLFFLSRILKEGSEFFCVDRICMDGLRDSSITYIRGNGIDLPTILSERPGLETVRKAGGFDVILSNGTVSPGGLYDHTGGLPEEGFAPKMVNACIDALNAKPTSMAVFTPYKSVLAFNEHDIAPFAKVKYWTEEDYQGMEFSYFFSAAFRCNCTAAILGRKSPQTVE
jgi:hypothetical protein